MSKKTNKTNDPNAEPHKDQKVDKKSASRRVRVYNTVCKFVRVFATVVMAYASVMFIGTGIIPIIGAVLAGGNGVTDASSLLDLMVLVVAPQMFFVIVTALGTVFLIRKVDSVIADWTKNLVKKEYDKIESEKRGGKTT